MERTAVAIFCTDQVLCVHIRKCIVCSKKCCEAYTKSSHLTPIDDYSCTVPRVIIAFNALIYTVALPDMVSMLISIIIISRFKYDKLTICRSLLKMIHKSLSYQQSLAETVCFLEFAIVYFLQIVIFAESFVDTMKESVEIYPSPPSPL